MKTTNLQRVKSILLISNSAAQNESFLQNSIFEIENIIQECSSICFVPYAAVTLSFDQYFDKFKSALAHLNIRIESAHSSPEALEHAETICVGGGNTFALIDRLQKSGEIETIRKRVESGIPYIGWSAGSNIAAPTIGTTNDMPIIQPASFDALDLVPFQINPHYTDATIEGHGGESREDRIQEYIEFNRDKYVVGLREGMMIKLNNNKIELIGKKTAKVFKYGEPSRELSPSDDINFLMAK